jgi:hypothetical protein
MSYSTPKATVELCPDCAIAASCWYRPILGFSGERCEMFETEPVDYGGDGQELDPATPPVIQTNIGLADLISRVYKGLCMNCKHVDTCTLPKAEGGVWHCEEYE